MPKVPKVSKDKATTGSKLKNLVIVESPTKARTLSQFLGKDYQITASMGHVRDLPRGEFGVDVENNFKPQYVIPKEKIKSVNQLVKDTAGVEHIWLATDPDREGEAIAWNLLQVIIEKSPKANLAQGGGKVNRSTSGETDQNRFDYQRVVFHEITKDAIQEAFNHPRDIDNDLVQAQQARRVLDRLVGYKLSPLLWKKVKSGLSAGRVQSVALRIVVEREREINAFTSVEYWQIEAELIIQKKLSINSQFTALLVKIGDQKIEIKNKQQADKIIAELEKSIFLVDEVISKDAKKYPNPPFTTSTLTQAAATRLGFTPKRTMRLAQNLYERGLITYMRTDSVNISPQAVSQTRKYIQEVFGKNFLPSQARKYKVKSRLAQEAHEAIRPTNIKFTSDQIQPTNLDQKKLYDLIWKRMVVCQMAEAIVAETTVVIKAKNGNEYTLKTSGQKVKFEGWYKVYDKWPIKEQLLPDLIAKDLLNLNNLKEEQKFTEPPQRFTEATLIKELEKHDIGRPSTYAPTISTLYERFYIERLENRKIGPTPIGMTTIDFLVKYFPEIVDLAFTANMENKLDLIAQGQEEMSPMIRDFWKEFEPHVIKVGEEAQKMKVEAEVTEEKCQKCSKAMVIRYGRFGKFLACSGFPECKNTKAIVVESGMNCPDCDGSIVIKRTKKGRSFWGCTNYPKCKFASWKKPSFVESDSTTEGKPVAS